MHVYIDVGRLKFSPAAVTAIVLLLLDPKFIFFYLIIFYHEVIYKTKIVCEVASKLNQ